jgi:H+/Cl- antiporter ClcA
MLLELLLLIGVLFGLMAALAAFIIIYSEYSRHRLARSQVWREAIGGAVVAFVVFLLLSLAGGWFFFIPR